MWYAMEERRNQSKRRKKHWRGGELMACLYLVGWIKQNAGEERLLFRWCTAWQRSYRCRLLLATFRETEDGTRCSAAFGGNLLLDGHRSSRKEPRHARVLKGFVFFRRLGSNLRKSSSQNSRRETNFSLETANGSWFWDTNSTRVSSSNTLQRQCSETAKTFSDI